MKSVEKGPVRQEVDRVERVGTWINGEDFAEISGLGVMQGVVFYGQDFEADALWDF